MNIRVLLAVAVAVVAVAAVVRRQQAPSPPVAEAGNWSAVPAPVSSP